MLEPFQPIFLVFYSRKKEGGKNLDYFRFRSVQKLTTPMAQATATVAIITASVETRGASVMVSAASATVGSYSVDADAAGSGSIGVATFGASSTTKYVVADDDP
jgi:NADPH-dependent curcumin reductase CurA